MQASNRLSPSDTRDREDMFRLFQERGPMTETQLLAAGFSKECLSRNAAYVAERIRLSEPMAA